jgi:hypothetical protein
MMRNYVIGRVRSLTALGNDMMIDMLALSWRE